MQVEFRKEDESQMSDGMKKLQEILKENPHKIILSNRKDKTFSYIKMVIRPIVLKGKQVYQVEKFTEKQVFHENVGLEQLSEVVFGYFPENYGQVNVFFYDNHGNSQWDFKMTKKGKILFHGQERKNEKNTKRINIEDTAGNNRKKNYLLKEGSAIPPLIDLGIFTKEGKVVRSMYDKYKQINRFLELVEDVVKDYPNKNMNIIDFGCGKSYLTFILYYYLVEVKGYPVHITGLDLKEDVIVRCNETAKKYGYNHLKFQVGDINGYQTDEAVDMVVTLHACDTATDYALYNAIRWNAGIILSVPCCQKELNAQTGTGKNSNLAILTKYGIVKERFMALTTDAIRANVLEYFGYKTQMLEFVDYASSPKNILIRAVKGSVSNKKKTRAKEEIASITAEFGVRQTLVELTGTLEDDADGKGE